MPDYTGDSSDNTINGSNGSDTISGGGGDDALSGGNGSDTISGGEGDDDIDGGNGNDDIDGGSGDDEIDGGNGDDGIDGGSGDDEIDGGNGDDDIDGGDDDDIIYGGNGGDTLAGGDGNDELYGQNGNDHLTGGAGDDLLDGNNGFDIAYFSGPIGEYSFYAAAGYLHVVHLGGAGADGHDRLIRVERLVFADRTIDVGVGDNAPVAGDDHVFIDEDAGTYGSGAASVLDNDFDFDGDALTVTGGTFAGTYGTLTLNADGTYSYTLNASAQELAQGDAVTDSFNYTVSDDDGSDTGTLAFHIAGVNDGPTANPDADTTSENAAILIDVLANDTDIDNGAVLTVTAASAPAGQGTASVIGNQVEFDPGGDFDDLAVGDSEVVVVSYSISDEHGATSSSTVTVTVTGTNDGPVANPDSDTTSENAVLLVDVLANDTDVDNGAALTVTAASAPAGQGSASVVGNQVQFDPGTDFDDLAVGESEVVVVSYDIEDEHGASSSSTVTITVTGTNDRPVANPDSDTTSENAVLLVDVLANDTDVDNGAVLTVTAASAPAGEGTASVVGNQVQFDPGSDFDYLAVGESAVVVVGYDIEDEHGASSSSTLTITVTGTNDAPTIDAGGTDATGSVAELPNNDPDENAFTHSDSGAVAFDDVDLSDTHSASFTSQAGGYLGTFALDPVDQIGDSVGWTFSVEDSDLDFLDDGETLTQTYTVEVDDGNGGTATQDVTITLTGAGDGPQTDWYIDNSAVGSANLGTEADPFTSIASFNAAQGTVGGPQVGATVYLLAGTGTYTESDGLNLLDDQTVVGVASGPLRPTIVVTGAGNDGIELAQNNTISGLDIGDTADAGIVDGNGSVGTLTISDVGKSGTGQILDIDQGGTLNVTLNSAESLGSNDGAIDLAGVDGSFTVTGATTITGIHSDGGIDVTGSSITATFAGGGTVSTNNAVAVNFVGNTGALALGGGFDIVTTTGGGLNASGGGSVTATGGGNSITSLTGTALSVVGTDIGLAGLTFESVSSDGAANGIVLDNTGTTAGVHGGLTVTGDAGSAANGSGGTIANSTGVGILLNATRDVSLDQIEVQNGGDDGIRGTTVENFALTNSSVSNGGDAPLEHGVDFTDLLGNGVFTDVTISNYEASQVSIVNNTGTASVAFTGLAASSGGAGSGINALHGLHFETLGTASADLTVLDSTFDNLFSNSVNVLNQGTGTLEMTIANSAFTNTGASAISLTQSNSGATRFYIHDNPTFLRGTNNGVSAAININQTAGAPAGSVLEGAISNNVIGDASSSTSATTGGDGIRVFSNGAATTTVRIDGNDVQGVGGNGINVQMGGSANPAHTMNVTMFDNTVTTTDINSFDAIRVVAGASTGNAGILRLDMHDNDASSAFGNDFQIRQRFATTMELLNYPGGPTDLAAVETYFDVTRNNDALGGGFWFLSTQAPGGGFQSTASVPQPTLPSPLFASEPATPAVLGDDAILSQAEADALADAAIQRWAAAGATAGQLAAMEAVSIVVGDMAGTYLGSSEAGAIHLDGDGAGHGWFVDATPGEDSEFTATGEALAGGAADGRIDALTVIMHELGHQIGLADDYSPGSEAELMHGFIDPGERRLPDGAFETGAPTLVEGVAELGGIALLQEDISAV